MKIVATSNFAEETYAEYLVSENIKNEELAKVMCEALNAKFCNNHSYTYYQVKPDDYILWLGMADLV